MIGGFRVPLGSNSGIDPLLSQTALGLAETAFKTRLQPPIRGLILMLPNGC
jgi:hypothetical protein